MTSNIVLPRGYLDACPYCDGRADAIRASGLPVTGRTWFDCRDCGTLYARYDQDMRFLLAGRDGSPNPPPASSR